MQTVPTKLGRLPIEFASMCTLESRGDVAALGVANTPEIFH